MAGLTERERGALYFGFLGLLVAAAFFFGPKAGPPPKPSCQPGFYYQEFSRPPYGACVPGYVPREKDNG